ncbi:MAG: VOC family protein [Bacteroidota bacterium]
MANVINWFEIPASNFDRALKFYGAVLNQELQQQEIMGTQMGFFNNENDGVSGSVCYGEGYVPSATGALVYLSGGQDLAEPLGRVESAGGQVVMPKTKISDEIGYMAVFMDSEGNRMAFHSPN